jgi:hypothetical protein
MKTIKYLGYTLSLMLLFSSCEQEVAELMDPCEADLRAVRRIRVVKMPRLERRTLRSLWP